MSTHFLSYWRPASVDRELKLGGQFDHSASNQYWRVKRGDTVWIVTVRRNALFLIGRMDVAHVVNQAEAGRLLKINPSRLWKASHHVIADNTSVAPLREIAIKDIASRLRFQSDHDRLDIKKNGVVRGWQLQTMRKLTADSAGILEARWRVDDDPIAVSPATNNNVGGGFGLPIENQKIERAAIAAARKLLEADGWTVESVEAQKVGYDLHCTRKSKILRAEVKGVRGNGLDFIITAGEYARAIKDAEYEIIVVSSALTTPQLRRFSANNLKSSYQFAPIAYRASFLG